MSSSQLPLKGQKPLPSERRPACNLCGKPLKAFIRIEYQTVRDATGVHMRASHRYFTGSYGLADRFCGINHAAAWAVKKVKVLRGLA